ncbi:hypothetical protein DB32_003611 [Sandaracinus amylolyticus]|uniref:Uncharacterized protein n=2 Tax=Sandaracinus amylolyticus TaxID=927083 RepID=A0A0F6W3D4_9BACT|nr:hypothetical protein DB32_003611 [Sandaracinus amylolyticus]
MLAATMIATSCIPLPRERVSEGSDEGYPTCGRDALPEGDVIARGALRAGPVMQARSLIETFEVRRRDCVRVFTGNQSWDMSSIDLDVVYDEETQLPLRAWKRIVSPGARPGEERIDLRRFELRTPRVALTQQTDEGGLEHFLLRGERPRAIIGPGRGLLTMWIQRAQLPVGGRLREHVLDIRESIEVIREVTLRRVEDRDDPAIGRRVRVYTIYGREPIYTDENDVVLGDMMGLVPAERVTEPLPPRLFEPPGAPDPVHTP